MKNHSLWTDQTFPSTKGFGLEFQDKDREKPDYLPSLAPSGLETVGAGSLRGDRALDWPSSTGSPDPYINFSAALQELSS